MACNKCKCKTSCNCTPSPCATTPIVPVCADPEYCEDVYSTKCIVHDGDDLPEIGAENGETRLDEILTNINDALENLSTNGFTETHYTFFNDQFDFLELNTTDGKFYKDSDNSEYVLEFDVTGFKSFYLEATGKIDTADNSGVLYVRFYNGSGTLLDFMQLHVESSQGSTEGTVKISGKTYTIGSGQKHHLTDAGTAPGNALEILQGVTKITIAHVGTAGQITSATITNFILTVRK